MPASEDDIGRIYRLHADLVLRRARQILGSDDDAHEVLQDLFMSLLANPAQFAARSSLTTWLYSATTHLCLNMLRNRQNRLRLVGQRRPESGLAPARADELTQVRQLLSRLSTDLAEVVVYYYVDEMTHDEIAELVGCSRRQVGYLLERARQRARELSPQDVAS